MILHLLVNKISKKSKKEEKREDKKRKDQQIHVCRSALAKFSAKSLFFIYIFGKMLMTILFDQTQFDKVLYQQFQIFHS
jgi:hypothetical protein